jgi:hypothetical protein
LIDARQPLCITEFPQAKLRALPENQFRRRAASGRRSPACLLPRWQFPCPRSELRFQGPSPAQGLLGFADGVFVTDVHLNRNDFAAAIISTIFLTGVPRCGENFVPFRGKRLRTGKPDSGRTTRNEHAVAIPLFHKLTFSVIKIGFYTGNKSIAVTDFIFLMFLMLI